MQAYEKGQASFIIVARKTTRLLAELQSARWQPSPRTDADEQCEFCYQPEGWGKAYRFIALRYQKKDPLSLEREQYQLFDSPQYIYRVFVTNMKRPIDLLVWFYNQRAPRSCHLRPPSSPSADPLSASNFSTQRNTAWWVSTSISRRVREIVEWSGGIWFSPTPRNPRSPMESAARHAIPRSLSMPSKAVQRFGAAAGDWLRNRFTVHYTPKHGSWLNQAEIEISLLSRQCLGRRRIGDRASLQKETRAWNRRMNRDRVIIQWSFTRKLARQKFGYKITRSRY